MIKMLKKEKAVTLVALIITIIVLLVLAGIVFVDLTSENGVLERVGLAIKKSSEAEQNENNNLDGMNSLLGEYLIARWNTRSTSYTATGAICFR